MQCVVFKGVMKVGILIFEAGDSVTRECTAKDVTTESEGFYRHVSLQQVAHPSINNTLL